MSRITVHHTIKGTILRETEKALQFRVDSISGEDIDSKTEWFPKSQIDKQFTSKVDGEDWLLVSEWILQQKELM